TKVELANIQLTRLGEAARSGGVSQADVGVARQAIVEAEAALATAEARLRYLVGGPSAPSAASSEVKAPNADAVRRSQAPAWPHGVPQETIEALEKTVDWQPESETGDDLPAMLSELIGIKFVGDSRFPALHGHLRPVLTGRIKARSLLQALADAN